MSRKITFFYAVLIAVASLAVGMVIASRLDLSPESSAQTLSVQSASSGPLSGPLDAGTFRTIARAQTPMVVSIRTESRRKVSDMTDTFGGGNDLFRRFFGMPDDQAPGQGQQGRGRNRQPREQISEAAGSGFIISKDGYILTNNHVVEGASGIFVRLYSDNDEDNTEYNAKLVGRDQLTDSALIQLVDKPSRALPEAKLGDSTLMQPGDWVMAIGNPFRLSHTVSVGVISANRPGGLPVNEDRTRWQDVLQTDAAINPGNSGGPLLNIRGEVIGINTAIISDGQAAGNVGVGFAVPINAVRDLLPQLRAGKVVRGRIGVTLSEMTAAQATQFGVKSGRGALVATVDANGPAAKAGFEPGDIIIEYNGQPVRNRDQVIRLVTATRPGVSVPIKVLRNKQEKALNVTIEELNLEAETASRSSEAEPQEAGTGWGMSLDNVTPDVARQLRLPPGRTGAVIVDLDPYSAADKAGLRRYDVIMEIDRQPVRNRDQAREILQKVPAGSTVGLLIWRSGQETFVLAKKD